MDQILDSIKNVVYCYNKNHDIYWNNKEFVLKAIKIYGCGLKYASEELQNNKEVVLKAVKKNGICLEFASEKLQNDKKIVIIALKNIYFVDYINIKKNNNKFFGIGFYKKHLKKSFHKILEFY